MEAILEIQFDVCATLPELYYAKLTELPQWKDFQQLRLPAYEIPPSLRAAQPQLRFAPVLQLVEGGESPRMVRMGPQVVSYHRVKNYGGWETFKPELDILIDALFDALPAVAISRLGLRYLNGFTAAKHGISAVSDLDFKLKVADEVVSDALNINYSRVVPGTGACMVRIATPDFVQGGLSEEIKVFIDVDVFSAAGVDMKDKGAAKAWIDRAHGVEKEEFFHLLTQKTIDSLKEV